MKHSEIQIKTVEKQDVKIQKKIDEDEEDWIEDDNTPEPKKLNSADEDEADESYDSNGE